MDFNIRFVAMNDSGTEDSEVLEYVRRQRKGGSDSDMNRWLGKLMPGRAEQ
jgi:hypothetical protein